MASFPPAQQRASRRFVHCRQGEASEGTNAFRVDHPGEGVLLRICGGFPERIRGAFGV